LDTYITSNGYVCPFSLFSVVSHILGFTEEVEYSFLCGNYFYPFFWPSKCTFVRPSFAYSKSKAKTSVRFPRNSWYEFLRKVGQG